MEQLGIFYLSGTGNTKAIAELFAKYYQKHNYQCETFTVDSVQKGSVPSIAYSKYDVIGIGSPIYGSNAALAVEKFVEQLPQAKRPCKAFIFLTGADFIVINQGASYKLRSILKKKGYTLILDRIYPMGSNWCYKYADEMAWQLYLANERKINLDVQMMVEGRSEVEPKRGLPALCAFLGKLEHLGAKILSTGFAVNDKCIDCGKCIQDCPTGNITRKDGQLQYGKDCLLCMKCMYYCPVDAIYLKKYKFMGVVGGYRFEDLIKNPNLKGDFLTKDTKGYHKHFYAYVKSEK